MADINQIVGGSGDDTLSAVPGTNDITGGPGNDTISVTDGLNTIEYQSGDGLDSVKFALPRTYQYARFLTEANKGLADFTAYISTANTGLINALPFDISSVLSDMRRGIATPAMADAARNQLIDWIGTPVGNVIQFGAGITLSDITIQVGATASFGAQQSTPVQFAVALNSEEGMVFGLDGPQIVARDLGAAPLPPTIDMTFQFADGSSATLAELLAGPGLGVIGDQTGSDGNDFLHGSLSDDTLMGNGGDDKLDGGAGADRLFGGDGDDVISGGSGDDAVYGEGGNDVLASGKNGGFMSYMSGGPGDDVYCFNRGDGLVTIDDQDWSGTGVDTLSFGNGVALSDVVASVDPSGNLMLGIAGTTDVITIPWFDAVNGMVARADSAIERVQFFDADGTAHVYDLGSLVNAAFPDPTTADPAVSVVLVDPGSAELSVSEVGQPYARSYALTGNLFPPENTAPTAGQAIEPQSATQGMDFSFQVPTGAFVDIDNDTLSYSAKLKDGSDLPSWLTLNPTTGEFSGKPSNADVVDMLSIEVTASDGSASASQEFSLSVANVNDAPTAGPAIGPQSATQGMDFSFQVPTGAFVDIDNDTLSYSAKLKDGSNLPSWLTLNPSTGEFSGKPSNADVVDMLSIKVTASDGSASASQEFSLSVANVNDAPTAGPAIGPQSATQGMDFSFQVPTGAFVDIDNDTLSYSAKLKDGSNLPSWLTLNPSTGEFSGKPSNADVVDMLSIKVTASDGSASASQEFSLSVANVNDAPTVANPMLDQTATQGVAFSYKMPANVFADIDKSDTLTYTAKLDGGAALPSWLHFDGSTFTGTPGAAGTWNIHLVATDRSGASVADEFKLTAAPAPVGSPPVDPPSTDPGPVGAPPPVNPPPLSGRIMNGTRRNDRLHGTSRDDMISGGRGRDVLLGADGNDILRGGSGDDRLDGGSGRDYLEGGSGNDNLKGGSGVDLLQGGSGDDQLTDTSGNGLLDGGSGNDTLTEGSGNSMLVGGKGNDHLYLGGGYDIIAFNRGDGRDIVSSGKGGNATLSLGGGIRYQDLSLRRSGNDLILETGSNERITFEKWYAGKRYQAVSKLQVVAEAMPGFDPSGGNTMLDDKVESFDFKGLVAAFDNARRQQPGLSRWTLTNALAQFHLGDGSDSKALGGDLAYQYGMNGTLAGIAVNAAQGTVGSSQFGKEAQTLHSQSELKDGLVKLS